jgi:8-oxo-dGTP diphosphatase
METLPTFEKVVCYITYQGKLAVFRHVDVPEAGIQVPAGTVEPGEEPQAAALREANEESGLTDLAVVSLLGEDLNDGADWGAYGLFHRSFYHLECLSPPPEVWRCYEENPSGHLVERYEFELWWCSLPDEVPRLAGRQDKFLPELVMSLRNDGANEAK